MMKRFFPLLLLVAAACASNPSQNATQQVAMKIGNYSADMGESPVGVIPVATLHDAARNKDVGLSIDYPTRGGSFPVIVFSPGYGLSSRSYEPLVGYWVSNGYVVIRPSHADAGQIKETPQDVVPPSMPQNRGRNQRRPSQQGTVIPLQQNNPAEQIWDREREPQWQARVADVELIINSLDTLEHQFPELAGKMDHSKIGVGGHGYGAFTALLLGGMHAGNLSLADSRVKAIVAFSPPGVSATRDLTAQSFAGIHAPTLFMTGSNDRGANESENADWRKQSFENSPSGDKYFVLIDGARYSSFTGQAGIFALDTPVNTPSMATDPYGRPIPVQQPQQSRGGVVFANTRSILGTIKITSLAFWDAYLKNETSARDLLQPAKYDASFTAAHMTAK